MTRIIVHVTERALFKWCRRNWRYSYIDKIEPLGRTSDALNLGSAIHVALQEYYSAKMNGVLMPVDEVVEHFIAETDKTAKAEGWASWSKEDRDQYTNQLQNLGAQMLRGYWDFANQNDGFEIVAVEKRLRYDIPQTNYTMVGTLDLLIRWRGKLWVVDHKTRGQGFADPAALEFDDQMAVYLWLVWKVYGEKPGGAIYNQLAKSFPEPPPLVYKDTQVSRSGGAIANTTREMYLQTIRDNGFNEADYEDVLNKLTFKQFFKREPIAKNQKELDNLDQQILREIWDMDRARDDEDMCYPNPTHDCVWSCSFKTICLAKSGGGDEKGLIKSMFRVHEGRDAAYELDESPVE